MYCARCQRRTTVTFDLTVRGKRLRVCQACHERDLRRKRNLVQLPLELATPRPYHL